MIKVSFVLVVFLVGSAWKAVEAQVGMTIVRVRALDGWASESLERAHGRSPFAQDLIRQLESSDLIVHIVTVSTTPFNVAGTTRFVSRNAGYRYVRISLNRALLPDNRAAILGHELQHACELAASDASDNDGVRRLYEAIGWPAGVAKGHFETRAAAAAGLRVWSELHGRRPTTRRTERKVEEFGAPLSRD